MRDPNRIDLILTEIARVWKADPDLRLGQLIDNVTYSRRPHHQESVFFVEDTDLLAGLQERLSSRIPDDELRDIE